MISQDNINKILMSVEDYLFKQSSDQNMAWLDNVKKIIFVDMEDQFYLISFSIIPRLFSKETLNLTEINWRFKNWSHIQLARTFFILTLAKIHPENFKRILYKMLLVADTQELITFYQILPLLPKPETFIAEAVEGIRSNITNVFNAIALNNTYPSDYFSENAWNQLVLKAFFIDSPVDQIIGIEKRANSTLAYMLIDYANERLSARRPVKDKLWHIIRICADEKVLTTLKNLNISLPQGTTITD